MTDQDMLFQKGQLLKTRISLAVLWLITLITQLIDNAFTLITPTLIDFFKLNAGVGSWAASLGSVGLAIGFIIFSGLSDFISEKKLLIVGILLFCVASIVGLIFQHFYSILVIVRFFQAIGGISTSALYLVLIARYTPAREKVIWIGFSTTSFTLSTVIGTVAGGYITTYFGWQVIFYIPLITLFAIPVLLKNMPSAYDKSGSVDVIGIIILSVFTIATTLFITEMTSLWFIVMVIFALIFYFHISKSKHPLVTISFFKNKTYLITLISCFFFYLSQVAVVFIVPFMLQKIYGLSLDKISLLFIIPYILSAILAVFSGNIIRIIGYKATLITGAIAIVIGMLLLAFIGHSGLHGITLAIIFFACGYALCFTPFLSNCINCLADNEVGTGIGFFNFVVRISIALGIAFSGSLMNIKFMHLDFINILTGYPDMVLYKNIFLILILTIVIGSITYLLTPLKKHSADDN